MWIVIEGKGMHHKYHRFQQDLMFNIAITEPQSD